jgi:iron uptake system component EfeO
MTKTPTLAAVLSLSLVLAACGDDDERDTAATTHTGTTPVTVDTTAVDPQRLDIAMRQVASYARGQTSALIEAAQELEAAVEDGSIEEARSAYAEGRPYYERIEPLVALFPELDGAIDAREDDFPQKAEDPAWTGFHPIERMLWHDEEITARTRELAAGLVEDTKRLHELMRAAEVPPAVVIPGVAELVDEVEESKITGEEERYSKLDLPTFRANIDGAQAFFDPLAALVEEKDPELASQIADAFAGVYEELDRLREGGEYPPYDELSEDDQRALKQRIEALAEPLARVQGTLGVRS